MTAHTTTKEHTMPAPTAPKIDELGEDYLVEALRKCASLPDDVRPLAEEAARVVAWARHAGDERSATIARALVRDFRRLAGA